jgi:predicted metal-dependent phosphoesterase TrpH
MRIDLHCHTLYSPDSLMTLDALLKAMDRRELDMIAVTDHNTVAGARALHARAPGRVVIGEEIKTTRGELIALFLEEEVPPGLSPEETIARVHAQGALVGASHPFDRVRGDALGMENLEPIRRELDFLEVLNARMTFPGDNRLAREMAARWGLPGSAGSDAHAPSEVGRAYVDMMAFEGRHDFLDNLAMGQVGGRQSSPTVHLHSIYARWRKRRETRRR